MQGLFACLFALATAQTHPIDAPALKLRTPCATVRDLEFVV
jgi:hypothetical protein